MGIGAEVSQYGRSWFKRLENKILGLNDLHTYHRVRPLIRHLSEWLPAGVTEVVEFGCGDGINAFELAKARPNLSYTGYELNERSVQRAQGTQKQFFPTRNLAFHLTDVTRQSTVENQYECVLLMDIVEHIEDDKAFAAWITRSLKSGGVLAVSVPTHRYSKVFGQWFHRRVGHVRPGYTLEELTALFSGLELTRAWYNTGSLAQIGCAMYYKYGRPVRIGLVRSLMTQISSLVFRWFDPLNGPDRSCSIFAVFTKR
jgi:SAM-dependent methyltransferase